MLNSPNLSNLEVLILENWDIGWFEPRTCSLVYSSLLTTKEQTTPDHFSNWMRDVRMSAYFYYNYFKRLRVLSLAQNNIRPWLKELMWIGLFSHSFTECNKSLNWNTEDVECNRLRTLDLSNWNIDISSLELMTK